MFCNVKMNAISLATGSRPNDWDCSKAEWGDEMGDAPRASTPRRRINFVYPFFSSFFSFYSYDSFSFGLYPTNIYKEYKCKRIKRIKLCIFQMRRMCCHRTIASGVSTTPPCATRATRRSRSAAKSWPVRRQSSSSSRTPWKSKGFAYPIYFILAFSFPIFV